MQYVTIFPIYRKYSNNKVFFKIISLQQFEELSVSARGVSLQIINASIYPDKVRIQDMIDNREGYWPESSENEWDKAIGAS